MLNFQKVKLEDYDVFKPYYDAWKSENSTLNCSNMIMWRGAQDLRYAIENDVLYLDMVWERNCRMMYVPLPLDTSMDYAEAMDPVIRYFKNGCDLLIRCVDEQFKCRIERDMPDMFVFTPDRRNWDYVYNASDLMNYPGKKYHGKRNHINRLLEKYTPEYLAYEPSMFDECWELYNNWYLTKDHTLPGMEGEPDATRSALLDYKYLGFKGAVIRLNGKIEGFEFGQLQTDSMALIHVEKANSAIQGLYPYLTSEYVKREFPGVQYVNRMEDDEIEGLRKAKLSLYPCCFIEKYDMTLNYSI